MLDNHTWEYLKWNSYFDRSTNTYYVATPKVGCTTLKWWFFELTGHSRADIAAAMSAESEPDLTIHDTFHLVAPDITGLDRGALLRPITDPSVFRFAVVRNPFARLFSAFQSKILLREGLQTEKLADRSFVEKRVQTLEGLRFAFEEFLEFVITDLASGTPDVHWATQYALLRPDAINYSMIAKLEDTRLLSKTLQARVPTHLPPPFERPTNRSLIPYAPEYYSKKSIELVQAGFAADISGFDYPSLPPPGRNISEVELDMAIHAMHLIRGRNERITELNKDIKILRAADKKESADTIAFRRELERAEAQLAQIQEILLSPTNQE